MEEIADELIGRFDAEPEDVRRDVAATLAQLVQNGLLRRQGPESPSGVLRRIDLRSIPCFVINLEEATDRRRRIEEQLDRLGLRYEIVRGVKARPAWIGVALSHLKALRLSRAQPPFLVLEDDCEFNRHFRPVIDVPAEADALYLGISRWGLETPGVRGWGVADAARWDVYDEGHVRIHNMLARHAVLYLSSGFQHRVVESQVDALTNRSFSHPGDIGVAMLHASHVVLAPNQPVCRQRDRPTTAPRLQDALPRDPQGGGWRRVFGRWLAREPDAGSVLDVDALAHDYRVGPFVPDAVFDLVVCRHVADRVSDARAHHLLASLAASRGSIVLGLRPHRVDAWRDRLARLGYEYAPEASAEARGRGVGTGEGEQVHVFARRGRVRRTGRALDAGGRPS